MDKRLDKFGELVMTRMRDRAFDYIDEALKGEWKAPSLRKLQRALATLDTKQKDIVRRGVRAAVDKGIHDLLFALQETGDEDEISVMIDGKKITDLSDGLHGEPFGAEGWQGRFSEYGPAPEEP